MYKVFKDHAELAEYKTLAAAKKLAEKEHGEVFCDGKKVYHTEQDDSAGVSIQETSAQEATAEAQADNTAEADEQNNTGVIATETEDNTGVEGCYRIESLMNVRLHPALNEDIVGLAQPGTIVTVIGIKDDWMAIKNGNEAVYVLYGGGRYATRL